MLISDKFCKALITAFFASFCAYFGNKAAQYVDKKVNKYLQKKESESIA